MKIRVLFLCTENSCRSIMAESLLRHMGGKSFTAYSAGSHAIGQIDPNAIALLESRGHDTSSLRSKNWDEFENGDGVAFDYIFTLCDDAADQPCPVWPGHPVTAHWGLPNPADSQGTPEDVRPAYEAAYNTIQSRIESFLALRNLETPGKDVIECIHQIGLS